MKRVCIIGCGAISKSHAIAINTARNATLAAVCDIEKEKADAMAKEYEVTAIYDFDKVIKDSDIDSVHICTPHYLHTSMAITALEAGKTVFLEKPIAMNEEEAHKLLEAEQRTKGKICVSLQNRTNTSIRKMKQIFNEDKSLGRLIGLSGTLIWKRDESYYSNGEWRGRWTTEGGSLMCNQSIHLIDLMHFFAGDASRVRAHIATKMLDGVIETEDSAEAIIEFESGVRGIFFGTNNYVTSSPITLELDFENAKFRYADQCLYKIESGKQAVCLTSDLQTAQGKTVWGSGHGLLIDNFYSSLSENGESYVSLEDALSSAKTLFALYRSAKAGDIWVNVNSL